MSFEVAVLVVDAKMPDVFGNAGIVGLAQELKQVVAAQHQKNVGRRPPEYVRTVARSAVAQKRGGMGCRKVDVLNARAGILRLNGTFVDRQKVLG